MQMGLGATAPTAYWMPVWMAVICAKAVDGNGTARPGTGAAGMEGEDIATERGQEQAIGERAGSRDERGGPELRGGAGKVRGKVRPQK
jgi:hypothetical protein